jgi:hypothetical protein
MVRYGLGLALFCGWVVWAGMTALVDLILPVPNWLRILLYDTFEDTIAPLLGLTPEGPS